MLFEETKQTVREAANEFLAENEEFQGWTLRYIEDPDIAERLILHFLNSKSESVRITIEIMDMMRREKATITIAGIKDEIRRAFQNVAF